MSESTPTRSPHVVSTPPSTVDQSPVRHEVVNGGDVSDNPSATTIDGSPTRNGGNAASAGTSDESESGPIDLLGQISLTEFVVTADSVRSLEPFAQRNRGGEDITVYPAVLSVDEIVWSGSIEHEPYRVPAHGDAHVIDPGRDVLGEESFDGRLLVGLQSLGPTYTDLIDQNFGVTFVGQQDDGVVTYLGPAGERLTEQQRTASVVLAEMTALETEPPLLGVIDLLHDEYARLNERSEPPDVLTEVIRAIEAVAASDELSWSQLPVDQRDLAIGFTPPEQLDQVEAIGIEFRVSGDYESSDELVSVRSSLGVSHQFSVARR